MGVKASVYSTVEERGNPRQGLKMSRGSKTFVVLDAFFADACFSALTDWVYTTACARSAVGEGMAAISAMFGSSAKVVINFSDAGTRKTVTVKQGDSEMEQFLFGPEDKISGTVPYTPLYAYGSPVSQANSYPVTSDAGDCGN